MTARTIFAVTATLVLCISAADLQAQTVDMSLDLYYNDPADTNSAGTWQFIAKASHRGLAGLATQLSGVNSNPVFEAPWGSGTGVPVAGFYEFFGVNPWNTDTDGDLSTVEMLFGQIPVSSPGPQGLFYDVGVLGGATQPGENGTPAIAGFVPGNNVPWNFTDTLGDLFDDAILNSSGFFEGGVLLASGTFDASSSPTISMSPTETGANTFVLLGTATDPPSVGSIVSAAFTTQIRDNTFLAIVPEPSSLILGGLACALMSFARGNRSRRSV